MILNTYTEKQHDFKMMLNNHKKIQSGQKHTQLQRNIQQTLKVFAR